MGDVLSAAVFVGGTSVYALISTVTYFRPFQVMRIYSSIVRTPLRWIGLDLSALVLPPSVRYVLGNEAENAGAPEEEAKAWLRARRAVQGVALMGMILSVVLLGYAAAFAVSSLA